MPASADLRLVRLLQLASPTLPVGAFSYSQGLEAAVESGLIRDAASAQKWIAGVLIYSIARAEAPCFLRLASAWQTFDWDGVRTWNDAFLATREAAELRAETVQMGYSLRRLLSSLADFDAASVAQLDTMNEPAFPTAFSFVVVQWQIAPRDALLAYLWSWLENQVMAALKAVPLGQTDGQKILLVLSESLADLVDAAMAMQDDDIGSFAPGLALASSRHESQYSRLFRS
ncbi:MAG: urease accessory protein UreF [Betaproteobacteria bacterium]|nr:urease accessory protein UreF [Betaproteobacteria bacterium]